MSVEEARLRFVARAAKWSATIQDLELVKQRGFPDWIEACEQAEQAAREEANMALIDLEITLNRKERRCATAA